MQILGNRPKAGEERAKGHSMGGRVGKRSFISQNTELSLAGT